MNTGSHTARLRLLLLLPVLTWIAGPPCGAAPSASGDRKNDPELNAAIALHDRGVEGSEDAVDRAIEALEKRLEQDPDLALARAYLGSAYTLKARDVALWRKRGWVEKGIATLDEAVDDAPEDTDVRLVRAINAYNLPRMAGRYDLAGEDFDFLLRSLEADDPVDPAFERAVCFHAGAFALKQDKTAEAIGLLERARDVEGSSELAGEIETMLRLARNRLSRR